MIKFIARICGVLVTVVSTLTLLRPRTGWLSLILWLPKLYAGALVPVGVLVGVLAVLLGLIRRDLWSVLAGAWGTAVATRYMRRVTADHDGFRQAFGPQWQHQIPPQLQSRLEARRWKPYRREKCAVVWEEDIVYGRSLATGQPLFADLWQPPADVERTGLAVVYMHGGVWRYGSKNMRTGPFFRHLAAQGHLVVDIEYTLAPISDVPQMVGEVQQAVAWVKRHASELGINRQRVVLMGGSAGGHLALLTAYGLHEPALQTAEAAEAEVRAVVSFYGPPDFRALHEAVERGYGRIVNMGNSQLWTRLLQKFDGRAKRLSGNTMTEEFADPLRFIASVVGGTPQEVPEAYQLTSPITYVGAHCPPTLLIQNTHDFSGLVPEVKQLYAALRRVNVPVVYLELPNTEHGFDLLLPQISPAAQVATYDVDRFLALMV